MTSHSVEGTWIRMGGFVRLRGGRVKTCIKRNKFMCYQYLTFHLLMMDSNLSLEEGKNL